MWSATGLDFLITQHINFNFYWGGGGEGDDSSPPPSGNYVVPEMDCGII